MANSTNHREAYERLATASEQSGKVLQGFTTLTDEAVREIARQEVAKATTLVMGSLKTEDAVRQDIEDERAIKRNRNRLYTLLGAIFIGITVTYVLQSGRMGHTGQVMGPYSFVITVAMDATLAVYALIKRY